MVASLRGAGGGCQLLAEETVYAVVANDRGREHASMPAGRKERLSSRYKVNYSTRQELALAHLQNTFNSYKTGGTDLWMLAGTIPTQQGNLPSSLYMNVDTGARQ